MVLSQAAGRPISLRSDAHATRRRLVDGVASYVATHGEPPPRLADVASEAGVSVATAYRHFSSIEDVIRAHVLSLPERAAERFERTVRPTDDALGRLHRWDRAWVTASIEFGPTAVRLRSPDGFLARRALHDPAVSYVCSHVEPLLRALVGSTSTSLQRGLIVWNAVSDPREVLDLRGTARWRPEAIARFITDTTVHALQTSTRS